MNKKLDQIPRIVLLIETSRAYGRGLIRGIVKYAHIHGPWIFYNEPGGEEGSILPKLNPRDVDGIIARVSKKTAIKHFVDAGVPLISIGLKEKTPGLTNICPNNEVIGKMAANYFLDHGFSNFAYCGFIDMYGSRDRCEIFCDTLKAKGFEAHVYQRKISQIKKYWSREQKKMADWLSSLPRPIGLMAYNDDHGRRILQACELIGLNVPEEVTVLGVDNDELVCELTDPTLSSVNLNTQKAGFEAAALLQKMMLEGYSVQPEILVQPTHIVTRQSSDILAINDSDIVEAVRYIRRHANKPIQVDNVVDSISLSRRSLEQKFRAILGRSVYQEIRRARAEKVAWMLTETNMSITQISISLGYSSSDHISRFFRKEKGISLLAYRKLYGPK